MPIARSPERERERGRRAKSGSARVPAQKYASVLLLLLLLLSLLLLQANAFLITSVSYQCCENLRIENGVPSLPPLRALAY